jgi:DNA-binding NarL/FixJ family response regulator
LLDAHPLMRRGLASLINKTVDLSVCSEADTLPPAFPGGPADLPDVAIIDLTGRGFDGLELIKDLRKRYPQLPVVVLSMHAESLYAERAIKAGARGFLAKPEAGGEKILEALRTVVKGDIYLSDSVKDGVLRHLLEGLPAEESGSLARLNDRELQVLQLIGTGWANRHIAQQLQLSVKTVESHRESLKRKLRLKNSTELVQFAIKTGRS